MIVPDDVRRMLDEGALLTGSVSGGKDSQAQLTQLGLLGLHPDFLIHADLGRAEWPQSLLMCKGLSRQTSCPLVVVRRPQGDLVTQIEVRMRKLQGSNKPFWPSASNRYCTSDQKRDQINKYYRNYDLLVSVEGIRAEESPARAKKSPLAIRSRITAKRLRHLSVAEALAVRKPTDRLALTWYPIFDVSVARVYELCGHSLVELDTRRLLYKKGDVEAALDGWGMHPAYVFGNERVSCMLCVMASRNDLEVGARHGRELLEIYLGFEREGGFTFKHKFSLKTLDGV